MIFNGIDLVNISRFKKIIEKHGALSKKNKFLQKLFSEAELDFLLKRKNAITSLAGRFAAKEATVKAFSRIISLSAYNEILIINDIPELHFKDSSIMNLYKMASVSISHDGSYAVASVILEV